MNTTENSPQYLTVKECQQICRFKGPEAIRRAIYRGELIAIRIRANRLLILASSFEKWFHRNDVKRHEPKPKPRPMTFRERAIALRHKTDVLLKRLRELDLT